MAVHAAFILPLSHRPDAQVWLAAFFDNELEIDRSQFFKELAIRVQAGTECVKATKSGGAEEALSSAGEFFQSLVSSQRTPDKSDEGVDGMFYSDELDKYVVWHRVSGAALVQICDVGVITALAFHTSTVVTACLLRHYKTPSLMSTGQELLAHPEDGLAILHLLIPSGCLVCMSMAEAQKKLGHHFSE
eukprot:CAMPEP_0114539750 /NCGR_PEP_ID=MMETSP0114-20121206/404_1 /TAXON_ID=31324 /ORGANISM="Goniomonas sp, Strain m" /LENGTH=188 /DNA_ID=CAMNT_0001723873 /DNA_START=17 /DNA_END=583 /DNA_ORIENTATION=-